MKLTLKTIAVCFLAVLCLSCSAAVVFGGYVDGNAVQSEENLDTALSDAGLSRYETDIKKADSYKVVFFSGSFKYIYLFDGGNIKEKHIINTGSYSHYYGEEAYAEFDDDENDFDGYYNRQKADEDLQKNREKADEERLKVLEKAQEENQKAAEKQAKKAEKAGKLRD